MTDKREQYDWRTEKNLDGLTRPIFLLRSSGNKVDLLSFKRKMTDKREQYDWMDGKNMDGHAFNRALDSIYNSNEQSHL